MPRLYGGSKKDFGLHNETGLSLPGLHESASSKSSGTTSYYRSAMPDYDVGKQHGGLNISSGTVSPSAAEEVGEKKSKGWFGGKGKKPKKSDTPVSLIDEVAESSGMARPSPILQARASGRRGEEGRDQFGRPRTGPEAPEDEDVRMQLSYDAPVDITKNKSGLVKLRLLKPAGKEDSEVTLRRSGQGFGLHLSTGLPPITVTYVEPGGAAESAGVCVGDVVLEVNGEKCEDCDVAKIVALKSIIQQTNVSEDLDDDEVEVVGSNGITDTAWNKIKAMQHQDEEDSSRLELTQINGDSEKEGDGPGKFQCKAGQADEVQISETEWERIRGQRELVFDKNAPSTVIQHQAKKRGVSSETKPLSPSSKTTNHAKEAPQKRERTPLSSPEKHGTPEKTKSSSGRGGWFKKKKKETKSEGEFGVKQKSASLPRSLTGAVVNRGAGDGKSTTKGGGLLMKVTSIDDVEFGEDTGKNSSQVSDSIKKTFSYEGAQSPDGHVTSPDDHVTSSIPRSRSHNAMFRATLIQAVQQQQNRQHSRTPSDDMTRISHSHSESYDAAEERGEVGGGRGIDDGSRLGVEGCKIGGSQTDVSHETGVGEEKGAGSVDIDPNLRLTKSGVVKEAAKRPTLEVFGSAKKGEDGDDDATDGPQSPTTPDNKPIDLGAIPHTQPSLGRAPGHTRRDLVARSSVKRRLPSKKGSLLFKVDDSQLMGRKRVELSDLSPTHRPRTHTMPEKVSRKLIETPPVFSLPPRDTHEEVTPGKPPAETKSHENRNIPKEPLEGNNTSTRSTRGSERESTPLRQNSNTSTTSSAEIVSRAVAARKSTPSVVTEEGGNEEEGGEKGVDGGAGSAILARLRAERRIEKEKEKGEPEETKAEKTNSASDLRQRRRTKMVEKPVKSLGIASESEETTKPSPGSTPPLQRPTVNLRKTPSSEFKPAATSSSSSTAPSWIAMAEKKKQRVSALLSKRDDSSAEPQSPTGEVAPPTLSPTSPASPSQAPVATPTSNDKSTTPLVTELTTSTKTTTKTSPASHSPPTTKSTSFTKSTSPPTSTKPTTTPVTKSTPFTLSSTPKNTSQPSSTLVTNSTPFTTVTSTKHTFPLPTSTTTRVTKSTPSTSSPITKSTPSTSSPVTKRTPSTSSPVTKSTPSTSSPVTKSTPSTSSPVTKSTPSTSSPVTKRTPFPNSAKTPPTTTSEEREQEELGRPRKGTVKDRMAFFQK